MVIAGSSLLKVAGPSTLGIGRPGSHVLMLTPPKNAGAVMRASLRRERVVLGHNQPARLHEVRQRQRHIRTHNRVVATRWCSFIACTCSLIQLVEHTLEVDLISLAR